MMMELPATGALIAITNGNRTMSMVGSRAGIVDMTYCHTKHCKLAHVLLS